VCRIDIAHWRSLKDSAWPNLNARNRISSIEAPPKCQNSSNKIAYTQGLRMCGTRPDNSIPNMELFPSGEVPGSTPPVRRARVGVGQQPCSCNPAAAFMASGQTQLGDRPGNAISGTNPYFPPLREAKRRNSRPRFRRLECACWINCGICPRETTSASAALEHDPEKVDKDHAPTKR